MLNSPRRSKVHKGRAAHGFRKDAKRTHPKNIAIRPMRGGWRL